jgi:hypothetical protein
MSSSNFVSCISAYVYDLTGSYTIPFLMCGVSGILAAVLMAILFVLDQYSMKTSTTPNSQSVDSTAL